MRNKSRKDIIKNIAIVFLVIMLVLTFFSNTILNWSLPQVSGKYTEYGEIKTGVRGSGSVISNMTYTESVKGLRTVEAVYVNRGTEVAKGDLLMLFSPTEVDGIQALEAEINTMQEAYDRAVLSRTESDYTSDEIAIRNAEEDLEEIKTDRAFYTEEYVAQVIKALEDAETAVDEAALRVEELEEELEEISEHSSEPEIVAARQAVEAQKLVYEEAVKAHEKAKEELAEAEYTDVSGMESQRDALYSQVNALEKEVKYLEEDYAEVFAIAITLKDKETEVKKAQTLYDAALKAYTEEDAKDPENPIPEDSQFHIDLVQADIALTAAETAYNTAYTTFKENETKIKEGQRAISQKNDAIADLEIEIYTYRTAITQAQAENREYNSLKDIVETKKDAEEAEKEKLDDLTTALENTVKRFNKSVSDALKAAKKQLQAATEVKTEADEKEAELSVIETLDAEIKAGERSLEAMKLALEQKKESDANSDKLEDYDLEKQLKAIKNKRSELASLKSESKEGYELRATYPGVVTEVNFKAGEVASDGSAAVVVEVQESGYTLSFSVSNSDVAKVKIGDTATVTDTYWGQNVGAVLKDIVPDAGGRTKTLTFELSGNVNVGQNLTLLVGERSTGYSSVIPKSALREDSRGKFIYITKTKSTPLGNRYVATRLNVTVAAEDDKNVAIVTDEAYLYEYVIVSATKPFEEGDYVRLSD